MGSHTVVIAAGDAVTLLVGQKLLYRVGLLDIGRHPVADTFPGGVRITAKQELPAGRVHLQQLGARRMRAVGRVDDQAGRDLHHAVHNHRLAAQDLAVDLIKGQRWIAAGGRPITPTGRGIDSADLRVWIGESPLDTPQFLPLYVEDGVREIIELASVVPVAMADDNLGDVLRLNAEQGELLGERRPVLTPGHLQVLLLLPPSIIEDHVPAAFNHPYVDRQVHRINVMLWVSAVRNEDAVGHKGAERYMHEAATFDQPDRILWGLIGSPGWHRATSHGDQHAPEQSHPPPPSCACSLPLMHRLLLSCFSSAYTLLARARR